MRGLLSLLRKYNYVIIFVLLEIIAIVLLSNNHSYQHSRLVNLNREISGGIFKRVEGARLYLNLRANNASLNKEIVGLRNEIEFLKALSTDTSTAVTDSTLIPTNYRWFAWDSTWRATDSAWIPTDTLYTFMPGKVVNATHHKQFNYLTINKGWKDSIQPDMAVAGPEGIVGIILESSKNFSTVLPIINRDFRLSVKIKRNDFAGILHWDGNNHRFASIHEIPFHAEIRQNDSIVTSSYSALFPEGLYVGIVEDFTLQEGNFYDIKVKLGTDYQRIYNINIIKNFLQEEQQELESNL